jgi:hypothetical protein
MSSTATPALRQASLAICSSLFVILGAGCSPGHDHFREDGPSVTADWDSPTAKDVKARVQPAQASYRNWDVSTTAAENGAVAHGPLYFEDPFEDKGHGRTDETHPLDVYRGGWEDYVAFPYCLARYWLNQLLLPASAVVTPPWTLMESDGRLSRQLLGYDHDALPVTQRVPQPPPAAAQTQPAAEPAGTPEGGAGAEAKPSTPGHTRSDAAPAGP